MTSLRRHHAALGAELAADGIPLHYGNMAAELAAAESGAILLDRSHEGRILLRGRDRLSLPNRMSTNQLMNLSVGQGAPTVFTNPNARILFRALCLRVEDGLLLISEAGQGNALAAYLRRSIFYGDQAEVIDISADTAQFAIHGHAADSVMAALDSDLPALPLYASKRVESRVLEFTVARRKPVFGGHWLVNCPANIAAEVHQHLLDEGAAYGLAPAGSLTYNSLRIRGGRPAGMELGSDYLPLEVGLWDEISFSKGCYTGQEIIARMESRQRIARTMVHVALSRFVPAPAKVVADGRSVGTMTSSVQAADGNVYALAVLKVDFAKPGAQLAVGDASVPAQVTDYAGSQPPFAMKRD